MPQSTDISRKSSIDLNVNNNDVASSSKKTLKRKVSIPGEPTWKSIRFLDNLVLNRDEPIHIDSDDEDSAVTTTKIDLTNEDPGSPSTIDADDIISDDEIVILGSRKCRKERKKQKVRQVVNNQSLTYENIDVGNASFKVGQSYEFVDGTFMTVRLICREDKDEFILVGNMFTRISSQEMLMPRHRDSLDDWRNSRVQNSKLPRYFKDIQLNSEILQRIKVAHGEAAQDYGLWRRRACEVLRPCKIEMTNKTIEDELKSKQYIIQDTNDPNEKTAHANGILRCRWREVMTHDEYGRVEEHRLERPAKDEIEPFNFSTSGSLRKHWRGATENLVASKVKPSMAEGFCGAGGMTTGAQKAGLKPILAFDIDPKKIATHKLNFPDCNSMCVTVSDWIVWASNRPMKVDVLHLSPPCQPWSPANTTPNLAKNEVNEAVLLACGQVIRCLRPRIVTIEESDGLMNRHSPWFAALVRQIAELGYTIRWSCLNCSDFDVPQSRKRIFIIAAGPGEDLPEFPKPTSTVDSVSVQRTLDEVEAAHRALPLAHHDPENQARGFGNKPPYDGNSLAKTITCKGGDNNYHPSGTRALTIREFLSLQAFPNWFRFPEAAGGKTITKTEMKIQLGNAVPPKMSEALLRKVMSSLMATDARRLDEFKARCGSGGESDAINLDDVEEAEDTCMEF